MSPDSVKLREVQGIVESSRLDQLFVVALLYDISVLDHENSVSILYGGETVGDDKAGLVFHKFVHCGLYLYLGA